MSMKPLSELAIVGYDDCLYVGSVFSETAPSITLREPRLIMDTLAWEPATSFELALDAVCDNVMNKQDWWFGGPIGKRITFPHPMFSIEISWEDIKNWDSRLIEKKKSREA